MSSTAAPLAPEGVVSTPLLHSIQSAGHRTGLSRSSIYRAMERGELVSVKVGSRRLIPESVLREYVERLVSSASAPAGAA